MSFNNTENEDKKLMLALQILKFQCDHSLDGDFHKKFKKVDNKLLNVKSSFKTSDILNDLLVKLPNVIDAIKSIKILKDQKRMNEKIVKENNKVTPEIVKNRGQEDLIEDGEIIEEDSSQKSVEFDRQKLIEANDDSRKFINNNEIIEEDSSQKSVENSVLFKNSETLVNQKLPCQIHPQKKAMGKANRFPSPLNQQQQNSSLTQNTPKNAKAEYHPYSSSESESEKEENMNEAQKQNSNSLAYKKCVQKLDEVVKEEVVEKELVEEVPETPEMTLDEIEKLAAENAKRNKRIRYFSTDSEDEIENTNKKKKTRENKTPKEKSSKKKQQPKKGKEHSQASKSRQETVQEKLSMGQENLADTNGQENLIMEEQDTTENSQILSMEQENLIVEQENLIMEQENSTAGNNQNLTFEQESPQIYKSIGSRYCFNHRDFYFTKDLNLLGYGYYNTQNLSDEQLIYLQEPRRKVPASAAAFDELLAAVKPFDDLDD